MNTSARLDGGETWTGSLRSGSSRFFERTESVFSLTSSTRRYQDEEEALKWAALEKLPTYDRLRTSVLKNVQEKGQVIHDQIDVRNIQLEIRQQLLERLVKVTDEDNELFFNKLRERIDRVGITLPEIEVRFEHLNIDADVYVGGRALPTLINFTINTLEEILSSLHLYKSNKATLTILHDVSGVVKPGRMTLLLGPPSSGKTTLLLALAGKLDKSLKVSGGVTYNGHTMDEFVPQRTSAYISQHDLHIGEMTVRETLDFSARCQGVGSRYDVLTELSRREKDQGIKPDPDIDIFMKATAIEGQKANMITDYILKILGLDVCADIMVGDRMRRGISGGQKKRVTTGEMIVGPAKALFMDEISTGLDSSTTYQIIRCLRQYVHVFRTTMAVSLLQPAPETFDLFDDIILLSEGQVVYQGPRESILEFFESMGFRCPERKGVADFLQEVTSRKDQEQYWSDTRQRPYRYVPVKEFADAFQAFHVGARLTADLSIPFDKTNSHPAALSTKKYGLNKIEMLKACSDREILLMKRSSFIYIFKLVQVTSRKDQEQYWADKRQPYRYIPVKEFAEAFLSFHVGSQLIADLSIPYDKTKSHPAALTTEKYGLSKMELIKACFDRELLLMKRSSFVYIFKVVQITMVALITLTVFLRTELHQRNITDGSIYIGALFFALVNAMFNGLAELSMTIARLPVFYKQRDFMFYPAWAYSLPTWFMRIPLSLMESGVWVIITYYAIGFAPNVNRFFRLFLLLFMLNQMALSIFRFIAALCRNMIVANSFGSFAILIMILLGGFIVSKDVIKGWWIWGYWSSPLVYATNAAAVNEFLAKRWQKPDGNIGVQMMESRGMFTKSYWYWLGIGALMGYNILFNILYTLALAYLQPLGKPQALISEDALEEKHANRTGESRHGQSSSREMQDISSGRTSAGASQRRRSSYVSNSSRSDSIINSARDAGKKGMVLPFQPLALAFDNVNYYVDMPEEMKQQGVTEDRLQLLRGVSGAFRPSVLTALVGVSGAGKTTLMDVLAGRKTGGYIEGSITISGYPKKQETFARIAGYCEQNDIHSPYVTVYESLVYSAWLRLPSEVDREARKIFVDEVMELVELINLRLALVGIPGVNGLSTEQRKRLTIAVELVANPSIIFMDEPTSGLDARAAAIVMRTVRNTVDTGRTVVCTIHQPSIDIFEAFDELVLMKRGGQMIYVGPLGRHSQILIDYFEAIEGVPKITPGYNPATWMLEISSIGAEMRLGVDFAEIYRNSSLYQRNQALIQELSKPAPGSTDLHFETQFSQPFVIQTLACLWKQHWSYWRNPQYNVVRFFFTMVCALLFGTIFWKMGRNRKKQQDVINAMGSMFAAVLFMGVNNASSVQPVVDVERTVFYREKAAGMYSPLPYAFAQVLIELPYIFAQSVLYGALVYSTIQFEWTAVKFFWFFFIMFFTFLYFTYYGMMTVALTPNANIAAIVSSAFYGIWMLFSGFLIPRPKIPVWWRWYYWACPVAWTLYGLIVSQYGDIKTELDLAGGGKQPMDEFVRSYFGFKHDFLGLVAIVVIGFGVLFAFIFALAIRTFNFQKR